MKKTISLPIVIAIILIFGAVGLGFAQAAPNLTDYFVTVDGQATGPHDTAGLKQLIDGGQLNRETFVWREGMPAWVTAGTVAELLPLFPVVPPPLPVAQIPPPLPAQAQQAAVSPAMPPSIPPPLPIAQIPPPLPAQAQQAAVPPATPPSLPPALVTAQLAMAERDGGGAGAVIFTNNNPTRYVQISSAGLTPSSFTLAPLTAREAHVQRFPVTFSWDTAGTSGTIQASRPNYRINFR